MRYIKLSIEYDGTNYQGWQTQRSGQTIQDILSREIHGITGERVRVTGASRTDAGVHAFHQVAAFGTESKHDAPVIQRALNARLPMDIRVLSAEETGSDFHPRYSARRKRYFYLINMSRSRSAFVFRYAWDVRGGLDVGSMRKAAEGLCGRHDFSAFRGSGCSAKTSVRELYSIELSTHACIEFMTASICGDFLRISIEANAFLRHMARNIVGTLVEIGRGRMPAEAVQDILASCDRNSAGPTAPAHGLFLEKICF